MGEQWQHCLQARERQVQLLKETSATARDLDQLSLAYMFLGDAAMDFKDLRTAEGYYTSALTVAESLLDQHSDYTSPGRDSARPTANSAIFDMSKVTFKAR